MSKAGVMHRVPVFDEGNGRTVVGMRYFPLVTPAKEFALQQARNLGHKGYSIESLPREEVARLLTEYAPMPTHYASKEAA